MEAVEGICELTLETRDRARMESFYSGALELPVVSRGEDRTWLASGRNARLGLWTPGEKEFGDEGGRHVHFALSVRSGALDALVGRLRSLGIPHDGPIEHDGGDRSAYIEDPEGNVVELWDYFENGSDVNDL